MKYIVELEEGVWIGWRWPPVKYGDEPVKMLMKEYAMQYPSIDKAVTALASARAYKPFPDSKIVEVNDEE